MRHPTLSVTCVGAAVLALVTVLVAQQANLGYDDTPLQPNRRWRIHDGTRPQPKVVKPGDAGMTGPAAAPQDAIVLLGSGDDRKAWQMMDGSL